MADTLANFINLIKEKTSVNNTSLVSLQEQKLYAQAIAVLQQDIDALLRVSYLLTIGDRSERSALMEATIRGEEWKTGRKNITDADMAAVVIHFNKWIAEVFDFGNLFGKITDHHDHKSADPLTNLTSIQKTTLRYYLSTYHQFPYDMSMTFSNVLTYLPKVSTKVITNLKRNLIDLENNKQH